MKFEIDVSQYISEDRIKRVWEDDFKIKVKIENRAVLIQANVAGLRSLAYQLLILSECKTGSHFHFDEEIPMDKFKLLLDRLVYLIEEEKYEVVQKEIDDLIVQIHIYLDQVNENQIKHVEEILKEYWCEIYFSIFTPVSFEIYRKALLKGAKDPDLLKQFAYFIELHGPDWDEEAKQIRELVEKGKIKEAVTIAKMVRY